MSYQGTEIDNRLHRLQGKITVRDISPLPSGEFPEPESMPVVLARAADHLRVSMRNPRARHHLLHWYEQISPRHVLSRRLLRPEGLAIHDARHHPRGLLYRADARTRIVAHLREHPQWTADAWSAAALFGIGDFSDAADTCVISGGDRQLSTDPRRPTRCRNMVGVRPWTLYLDEVPLQVTPPMLTLIRCLRSVLAGEHAWQVPGIARLPAPVIRAVQVTDRFRRMLGVDERHILQAGRELLDARKLARITALSAPGMDSTQETLLRLIAGQAAARCGEEFLPQVPVYRDGRVGAPGTRERGAPLLTVLDLALPGRRIGLMYDGSHHWGKKQRERDADINFELTDGDWLILRMSKGMLDDPDALSRRIEGAIRRRMGRPGRAA